MPLQWTLDSWLLLCAIGRISQACIVKFGFWKRTFDRRSSFQLLANNIFKMDVRRKPILGIIACCIAGQGCLKGGGGGGAGSKRNSRIRKGERGREETTSCPLATRLLFLNPSLSVPFWYVPHRLSLGLRWFDHFGSFWLYFFSDQEGLNQISSSP